MSVDGRRLPAVNGYARATHLRVAHRLTGLGSGHHLLTITVRGSKGSPRARGTQVVIDAVRVGSGTVVRNPLLTLRWATGTAGSSASLTFYGKAVSWTTRGATKATRVAVYVDGKRRAAHAVTGLRLGRHTVRIVVLSGIVGLRNLRVT